MPDAAIVTLMEVPDLGRHRYLTCLAGGALCSHVGDLEILSLSFILNSQVSTRLRGQRPSGCDRCPTVEQFWEPTLHLAPRLA